MVDVFRWIAVVEALGIAALPLAWAMFGAQPTRGIVYAKPLAVLLAGLLSWLLAALHLLPYSVPLALGAVALVAAVVWAGWGRRLLHEARRLERRELLVLLLPEALFLGAFAWQLFAISLNPDLYVSEKPMNFAFVNAIGNSAWFPPPDPWLSGHAINYYYFGHYVVSLLITLAGVPAAPGFSLAEATLFGLVAAIIFSIVFDVVALQTSEGDGAGRRTRHAVAIGCGAGAAFMALFTGNLVPVYRAIEEPGIMSAWLARGEPNWWAEPYSIHGILSELPWRTFTLSQLHSSDIALPFFLLSFAWGANHWLRARQHPPGRRAVPWWPLAALLLAGTALTSPWVFYPCLLLMIAIVLRDLLLARSGGPAPSFTAPLGVALTWLCAAGVAIAIVAVFARRYDAPGDLLMLSADPAKHLPLQLFLLQFGVKLVGLLIVLWRRVPRLSDVRFWALPLALPLALAVQLSLIGAPAAIAMLIWLLITLAIVRHERRSRALPFSLLLLFIAQTLDTMAFFVVIHDIENTFYKLGFLSWIVASIAIFAEVGTLRLGGLPGTRAPGWPVAALLALMLFLGAWMPAIAVAGATNRLQGWGLRTLDGAAFHFMLAAPGEYPAVEWLAGHAEKDAVLLEATGPSFSRAARVSSVTGLPTVVGWHPHELLWHQGQPQVLDEIRRRVDDVDRIYRTLDAYEARCLLQKYQVTYVFVGDVERAAIEDAGLTGDEQQAALDKFAQFMDRVYPPAPEAGATAVIYKTRATSGTACQR